MRYAVLILIGLLAILIVPNQALAQPGSADTLVNPDDVRLYADSEWGYSLEYPGNLQILNEGDGSVSFLDEWGIEVVRVDCYYDKKTRYYNPLEAAVDGIYGILEADYNQWELFGEEYEETWQGYQAVELWYNSFDGDWWWQECDYIVEANSTVYLVSMIWPEEEIGEYWDDFYQLVYSFEVN